jgi:hypothetical protein
MAVVSFLQPPEVSYTRKHVRSSIDHEVHYEPALTVVSGNYVTARRRGVVDGVDFGATGTGECSHCVFVYSSRELMASRYREAPLFVLVAPFHI